MTHEKLKDWLYPSTLHAPIEIMTIDREVIELKFSFLFD